MKPTELQSNGLQTLWQKIQLT